MAQAVGTDGKRSGTFLRIPILCDVGVDSLAANVKLLSERNEQLRREVERLRVVTSIQDG